MSIVALLIDLQYLLSLVLQSASPFCPYGDVFLHPSPKKRESRQQNCEKKQTAFPPRCPVISTRLANKQDVDFIFSALEFQTWLKCLHLRIATEAFFVQETFRYNKQLSSPNWCIPTRLASIISDLSGQTLQDGRPVDSTSDTSHVTEILKSNTLDINMTCDIYCNPVIIMSIVTIGQYTIYLYELHFISC